MTLFKTVPTIILAALTCSLAGACSAKSAETSRQDLVHSNSYLKPGAAITHTHDLKSQLSSGVVQTFTLTLNESYSEGGLDVTLTSDGDITLYPNSNSTNFDMSNGNSHDITISFTANTNGRHYINVQALAVSPSGQTEPRIFSIPVQVGPPTAQKPDVNMKTMEDGETIIEMEAQEVIK